MTVKPQPQIQLIPSDLQSETHVERLILQRIACGWHEEYVRDLWCKQQKEGHKSLYWIVRLSPFHISPNFSPKKQKAKIEKGPYTIPPNPLAHNHPQQSIPLANTPKTSIPDIKNKLPSSFVPIGHIALDLDGADAKGKLSDDLQNVFRISNFYISIAPQGLKLGSLAMDEIENLAMGKGRAALVLCTAAEEYSGRTEKFRAMGKEMPVVSFSFG